MRFFAGSCLVYAALGAEVGIVLVHLIQDGAKFLCHRKEKGWRLKGTKTLLYASIFMIFYIMIIGVGCMSIGWGAGDGMYCE